jgi:hypothetical protein
MGLKLPPTQRFFIKTEDRNSFAASPLACPGLAEGLLRGDANSGNY